jgi:ubiquitin-conjugating enzyme E2 W
MTASSERVAVFLVVIMGTLWNSLGVTTTVTTTLGSDGFLHRQATLSTISHRTSVSSKLRSNRLLSNGNGGGDVSELLLQQLRGGEISFPKDDGGEDSENSSGGLVATKLRNFIRSILQISDNKVPLVSGIMRTFFGTIETVTGMSLLPPPPEKAGKSKSGGKSKSKSKKKKKTVRADDAAETKTKKPSKKKSSASKKAATATKKHLSTSIKSTNPNYRIQKELKAFLKAPPDNLSVQVGSNIRLWIVNMVGAKDTIYEGEVFKLRIEFPKDYPTVPPSVYFLKKHMPIHEHVYTNGDICLSLLGNGWRPTMSAQSIAVSILSILSSAQSKNLPMDNSMHAGAKPGQYQKDWVYHVSRLKTPA